VVLTLNVPLDVDLSKLSPTEIGSVKSGVVEAAIVAAAGTFAADDVRDVVLNQLGGDGLKRTARRRRASNSPVDAEIIMKENALIDPAAITAAVKVAVEAGTVVVAATVAGVTVTAEVKLVPKAVETTVTVTVFIAAPLWATTQPPHNGSDFDPAAIVGSGASGVGDAEFDPDSTPAGGRRIAGAEAGAIAAVVIFVVGMACLAFFAKAKRTGRITLATHLADGSLNKRGAAFAARLEATTATSGDVNLQQLEVVTRSGVAHPAIEMVSLTQPQNGLFSETEV
jgi:hypothetical protein